MNLVRIKLSERHISYEEARHMSDINKLNEKELNTIAGGQGVEIPPGTLEPGYATRRDYDGGLSGYAPSQADIVKYYENKGH